MRATCYLPVVVMLVRLRCLLVDGLKAFLQTSTPSVVMIPHLVRSRSGGGLTQSSKLAKINERRPYHVVVEDC